MTNFTTDRRSIVKGAAWAVPALSVAAAAPSLAASTVPHDLSTSIPGTGTRSANNLNLNLSPTTFNNTGSQTVEGLTIVFEVDGAQTIGGIQIFGSDIKVFVPTATTKGYGSNKVTLTLAAGTGTGEVIIAPDGSYKAPLGQDLVLSSPTAFNLTVTVNASNLLAGDVPYMSANPVPVV